MAFGLTQTKQSEQYVGTYRQTDRVGYQSYVPLEYYLEMSTIRFVHVIRIFKINVKVLKILCKDFFFRTKPFG